MPGRAIFFLGALVCFTSGAAQISVPPKRPPLTRKSENPKPDRTAAESALDSANLWTQTALSDSLNLQPIERDLLLINLAHLWKQADRLQAKEYLKDALDHIKPDTDPDSSAEHLREYQKLVEWISVDLRDLDPNAWDRLIATLPDRAATDAISSEAEKLALGEDYTSALALARKSLARGGSFHEVFTLDDMILDDSPLATTLFDEIVNTIAKPDSDPGMLKFLLEDVFKRSPSGDLGDPDSDDFFNKERQQKLLDLLVQLTLKGQGAGGCSYIYDVDRLMPRFPPQVQGQLQSVLTDCGGEIAQVAETKDEATPTTTDDFVREMNEAANPTEKARWRSLAAQHAAKADHDYLRAVEICLDETQEEREQVGDFLVRFASEGERVALEKRNYSGLQKLVELLPSSVKARVEIDAAAIVSQHDKPRALLLLSDARAILETDVPVEPPGEYESLLRVTAKLSPSDLALTWRILVNGLNNFDHSIRATKDSSANPKRPQDWNTNFSPSSPWIIPATAIPDESFVRASVEDVASAQFRENLRSGIVEAFLTRYTEALKEPKLTATAARETN